MVSLDLQLNCKSKYLFKRASTPEKGTITACEMELNQILTVKVNELRLGNQEASVSKSCIQGIK